MRGMEYLAVKWFHDSLDEPVELFVELDELRFEVRKVEVFRDGHLGFADEERESRDTRLSSEALPSNEEIAADPQFEVRAIGAIEFELIWNRAMIAGGE